MVEKLVELHGRCDTDGDGEIKLANLSTNNAKLAEVLKSIDLNENGAIDFEELIVHCKLIKLEKNFTDMELIAKFDNML